jgi:hypothetical protein
MKWNFKEILWLIVCLIYYLLALWICIVNIQEIADRATGHTPSFHKGPIWATEKPSCILDYGLVPLSFFSFYH